jgi:predicted unusual protein kinase regulating ubiquinone biosynthesis (AarF/ABC1/UbiB family)
MTTIDYNKISDYLDDEYRPSIAYDPDVSLKALRPESVKELITNPYYLKAMIRFAQVFSVFARILLDYSYDKQKWTYLRAWIKFGSIEKAESIRRTKRALWLREKLLELGPTFIKIGQALSTRVDLLRKEYIDELSQLQDRVPPFDLEIVENTIEEELGLPAVQVFKYFNTTPLAAASLGQVHRATLKTGQDVVIKIQRPGLIDLFNLDTAILKKVARFCRKFLPFAKDRNWPEIVDEFGKTLFEEIDYVLEAKNAILFHEMFEDTPEIYIPEAFKEYTTRKILTLEYKPGIKIDRINVLDEYGIDREKLSYNCIEAYLKQFLQVGVYHADPHPGNLAVDPDTASIIFYDFGMVGRIDQKTKLRMISAFLNIVNRRSDALLKDLIALRMIDRNTADMEKIRGLIQWSLDNYYDVPYEEVRFEEVTDELADIMYVFPFRLPASFTYIVRAMVTLEGLSIRLNPKVNFMQIAVPYARRYVSKSEMFENMTMEDFKDYYYMLLDKISEVTGIQLYHKRSVYDKTQESIDKEDIELIRHQMINGFSVIGFGIILSFLFLVLAIVVVATQNIVLSIIFIAVILLILPFYLAVMLAVLLSKPTRPRDMLKKQLQQRNKIYSEY